MVEAEIVLGPLETLLDGPAQACNTGELGEGRPGRAEDEIIGATLPVAPVAANQEEALAGFVANETSAGTLACARRSASPAQLSGRYRRRSISAWPNRLA